ncbi:MAG TPA: hypothetical protein VFE32_19280 [Puia sp.]|nr:hypothetical protein [Puia sp.]
MRKMDISHQGSYYFYHNLSKSPKEAVKDLLESTDYDEILYRVTGWLRVAFSNEIGDYDEFKDREQSTLFFDDLLDVVEVIFLEGPYDNRPSPVLCKNFRDKYPILHIRTELFTLLNAVASYEGPVKIDKEYIGYYYLYLLTAAEVCHYLVYEK